jgi:hypothetical protein
VVRLLTIANDDLPSVEYRCEKLKREEASLKASNHNSSIIFNKLSDEISYLHDILDSYRSSCEEERRQMGELYQKMIRLEAYVYDFQDNNEEYLRIIKAVGDEVLGVLSNVKVRLRYALLSIAESMRNDPERYRSIIYNMSPSIIDYGSSTGQDYTASYMYGQIQPEQYPSPDHVTEDIVAVILEEAEKLFNKLIKDSINKVITDRTFSKSLSSLPLLQPSDEQQQRRTRSSPTAAVNQTRTCREENTFIQSEEIANEQLENKSC